MILLRVFLLVIALSLDILFAGFSYGYRKIAIPLVSACIVSAFSSGSLGIAVLIGKCSFALFSKMASILGGLILFSLGVWQLRDSLFVTRQVEEGDIDHNGILSPNEAVSLGFALSLDCMAAGIGAGAAAYPFLPLCLLCFLGCLAILYVGVFFGNWIQKKNRYHFSWLGGLILIVLGLWQIFS